MANLDFVSEVVFNQPGVFIHTTHGESDDDVLLEGRVQLVKKDGYSVLLQKRGEFVEWIPIQEGFNLPQPDQDWTMVNTVSYQRQQNQSADENVVVNPPTAGASAPRKSKYAMSFPLAEVKTIRRSKQNLGWSYLVFVLKDNVAMPPLHFHDGGSSAFVHVIEKYVMLSKSPNDARLYVVTPNDTAALSRSFNELQILGETSSHVVSQFMKDPVSATMGGFSKVTNFFKEALAVPVSHRPSDEYAELIPDLEGLSVNLNAEQGYELISQSQIRLGDRPNVDRRSPVTEDEWRTFMDKEGRINNSSDVLQAVFKGGLVPSLRKEAWKFLLKYYPWKSTTKERQLLRRKKEDEYFCMKAQWKTVTEAQESRFAMLRDRKSIIEKDVHRTDRIHPYFEGDMNPHLDTLYSILMTYCMYNFDLGYVQGMSDLLSPILIVMDDEVEAFWCLCGFMDDLQVCMNFDVEQDGMKRQLIQLNTLLQIIEPKFYSYLQSKESSNLYFCFRWLLIHFKREFTMDDIMRLWEVMWTQLPCKNFHLLLCVAILNGEKDKMEREDYDFNDILKHVNELALHIDVDDILKKGEGTYLQLSNLDDLPATIRDIIGITDRNRGAGDEATSELSDSSIEVLGDGDPSPQ